MQNTEVEIYVALRDHLKTYPQPPMIAYPSDKFDPPTDVDGLPDVYWIVQDARLPVATPYISNDAPDEYTGNFQVHIMTPQHVSWAQMMYKVALVANHFPKGKMIDIAGGRLQITKTPHLAVEPYKDGIYYRAPVLVPWRVMA